VPENSISLVAVAVLVPGLAGLVVDRRRANESEELPSSDAKGLRRIQGTLIVAAALILLTLPLVMTFSDLLASVASATGFDRVISSIVPYETTAVADLLRGFGLPAGSNSSSVWLAGGFIPVTAMVDWNCAGWQGFALFGLTSVLGLGEVRTNWARVSVLLIGLVGVFAVNIVRILVVALLGYFVSYPAALLFHDYGGAVLTLVWLFAFWSFVFRRENYMDGREPLAGADTK